MIINSDKKVICVKDIPSNIIEEAIFVLKNNNYENEELEDSSKEIILTEAEDIIEEYIEKMNEEKEDDEYEYEEYDTSINLKKEIIYIASILTILAICIYVVI